MSFFHASGSSKHILKVKPTSKFMLFLIVATRLLFLTNLSIALVDAPSIDVGSPLITVRQVHGIFTIKNQHPQLASRQYSPCQ